MASPRRRPPPVFLVWPIISLIVVHSALRDGAGGALSADEEVLLQFRKELYTTDSNRRQLNQNYKVTLSPCESWPGIECRNSSVISIYNTLNMILDGSVPAVLGSLPNLTRLCIPAMGYSGSIPEAVFNSSNLELIDLSRNRLTGPIPVSVGKLRKLIYLDFMDNQLDGTLQPLAGLAAAENFASLYLQNNRLEGDLSPLENLTSLVLVKLGSNRLTGGMSFLRNLTKLQLLLVQGNQLSGDLTALASLQTLQGPNRPVQLLKLDLASNQLTGDVSHFFFSGQSRLYALLLGNNNLTGSLNPEQTISDSSALETLELHNNQLSGPLGVQVLNIATLKTLKVNNNSLTGSITDFLEKPSMIEMNLAYNNLTGSIPATLFRMSDVKADLSYNNFSGAIPENAHNYVKQESIDLAGNPRLCTTAEDYNLPDCELLYPPASVTAPAPALGDSFSGSLLIIAPAVGISSFCLLLACASVGVCLRNRVHRRARQVPDNQHPSYALVKAVQKGGNSIRHRTMKELREATNNFSAANKIGSGGFGTVYRGILDGKVVAIKKSEGFHSHEAQKQVLNEITVFSQVRHRNLVSLHGCCLTTNAAMLVMEYVPLGSLASNLQVPKRKNLTWSVRLKICLQVAEALNYLHTAAQPPIYHQDVKSTNILLDNNFDAKVADFGVSKLVPEHGNQVSSLQIRGTPAYMDPDVHVSHHRTDKSDVYSFGVVLLELLMGRPVEELDFRRAGLASMVMDEESFTANLDPFLLEEPVLRYQDDLKASALALAHVAVKCLQPSPADRPSMRKIVAFLSNLNGFSSSSKNTPSPYGVPDDGDPAASLTAECLSALDRERYGLLFAQDSLIWGAESLTSEYLRALDRQKKRSLYISPTSSSAESAAFSSSHSRSRRLDSNQSAGIFSASSQESLPVSTVQTHSGPHSSSKTESIWMPHSAALARAKAATAASSGDGVVSRASSQKAASLSQKLESDFRADVPSAASTVDSPHQGVSLMSHSAPDSSSTEHSDLHFSSEPRSAGSAAPVLNVGRQPKAWRSYTSFSSHSGALSGSLHPGLESDDQAEVALAECTSEPHSAEDLSFKSSSSGLAGTEVSKGPQSGHNSDTKPSIGSATVSRSSIQGINAENRAEVPSDASSVEEHSRASSEPKSQTRHPSKSSSEPHSTPSTRSSPKHEIEEVFVDDYHAKF
ncbi:hypothetical protein Mapa_012786 [Marchantia paleacea]|nr:hypothetical protein Mapa_012786 [Marchantia paleacea]